MASIRTEKSIFGRLFGYRQREARSPEEDFFTEAFVGVLLRDQKLARAVFRFFTQQDVIEVDIRTQASYHSERPDIVMVGTDESGEHHQLFVESKLGSTEGEVQLSRYKKALKETSGKSKTLVYITKFVDEAKPDLSDAECRFFQKRWNDVFQLLKRYASTTAHSDLTDELIRFMEETNMSFDLKLNEVLAGVVFSNARQKYWNLLDEAWELGQLKRVLDGNTDGKWASYSDHTIAYQSPAHKMTRTKIYYGIWFNTNTYQDNYLKLNFPGNKQWPTAFVAFEDGQATAYQTYRHFFDSLVSAGGWKLLPGIESGKGGYIIRKSHNLTDLMREDLGDEFVEFFRKAFDELSEAPFFAS